MDQRTRNRLARLHAMLGSSHAGEAENARTMMLKILHEHGRSWNDLFELLRMTGGADARTASCPAADPSPVEPSGPSPLERILALGALFAGHRTARIALVLLLASALAIKGVFLVRDGVAFVGGFVAGAAVCANLKPEGVTRVEFRDCMNARGYE